MYRRRGERRRRTSTKNDGGKTSKEATNAAASKELTGRVQYASMSHALRLYMCLATEEGQLTWKELLYMPMIGSRDHTADLHVHVALLLVRNAIRLLPLQSQRQTPQIRRSNHLSTNSTHSCQPKDEGESERGRTLMVSIGYIPQCSAVPATAPARKCTGLIPIASSISTSMASGAA